MLARFFSICLAASAATLPHAAAAQVKTETTDASFEVCLESIRRISTQIGVAPINIVETDIMRMVRFPTSDGSVLVTCSKPDRKMVVTQSPNK